MPLLSPIDISLGVPASEIEGSLIVSPSLIVDSFCSASSLLCYCHLTTFLFGFTFELRASLDL